MRRTNFLNFFRFWGGILLFFSLSLYNEATQGQQTPFIGIRSGFQKDAIRIVLDSTHRLKWGYVVESHKVTLKIKHLIFKKTDFKKIRTPSKKGYLKKVCLEKISDDTLHAHILFSRPIKVLKSFEILPSKENSYYRVVLDIGVPEVLEKNKTLPSPKSQVPSKPSHEETLPRSHIEPKSTQPLTSGFFQKKTSSSLTPGHKTESSFFKWPKIIVIDPGHGGADPGAIGYSKTREKDVTLEVAKELREILNQDKKYKVILTRDRDKFTSLTERVHKTRNSQGDLFISLHADSHAKQESRGLSIYTLSKVASDQEAARLAAKENKADMLLGVNLDSESPEVAGILIDLIKRETMNLSAKFAHRLEEKLRPRTRFLDNVRRSANFAVLRTPDIPGVLIELGYISNKDEEKLLRSKLHQKKIAVGIKEAIESYFMEN